MKSADVSGSVVLLNSIYGIVAQDEELYAEEKINMSVPYPVIKSGIGGLTRQLSSYYGKYGIRINSICSGGIKGKVSGSEADMDNSFAEKYLKKVPLRRMATTDDIANMVCFLGSDASSYITGQNIPVDGGYSVI
jgi:NAD(P)-dependent dehydrogenase (short-subunit alcohol dehydrogenase family)